MRKWKIELKNYESCFCHSALKDELIFVPQKWEEGRKMTKSDEKLAFNLISVLGNGEYSINV